MDREKGRIRRFTLFVLIVGMALLAYACIAAYREPDVLEYMFAADEVTAIPDEDGDVSYTSDLSTQLETMDDVREELSESVRAVTLTGTMTQAVLTPEGGDPASGTLYALGEDAFAVTPRYLRAGRLFYPEELEKGERVLLLDEAFALALFRMTDVIGREAEFGGETYRVVGVLRHSRRVGEEGEYAAYIPLAAAEKSGVQLQTLTLSAVPVANSGAMTAFKSAAVRLNGNGTFYDIRQEKVGATMWARYLLCALAFAVLYRLLLRWAEGVKRFVARIRQRLLQSYMPRLLPWVSASCLWRAAALSAIALSAAWVFTQLIAPVYVYPDYIPAVLVEPEEIVKTFWNLQSQGAAGTVYRTVSAVRMAYFAGLCRWGTALTLYGVLRVRRGKGER